MMRQLGISLNRIVRSLEATELIFKNKVNFKDLIEVKTQNSLYKIFVLGQNDFLISGGWFDRKGLSPYRTKINGCTWGGSVIKHDVIASCGMCIEFGNRVTTTSIIEINWHKNASQN